MPDLNDEELNEKLEKLKKQELPSLDDIKQENKELEIKEKSFLKKFFKRIKKKKGR